ncbi:hypothetical protein AHAS_Ahas11G0136300 [Arachis hypogaea]
MESSSKKKHGKLKTKKRKPEQALLEKDLDMYCDDSMYASFQEKWVFKENEVSDGDDFEWVGGHSDEFRQEGDDIKSS